MTDVLIVSELTTVRAGLVAVLGQSGDLRVAGQGRSLGGPGVAEQLAEIDVVLFDAPSVEAVAEAVADLDGVGPGLLVLGPTASAGRLALAAPALAWGVLPRDATSERIVAAVRAVAAGLVVLDVELTPEVVTPSRVADAHPLADTLDELTAREHEVLTLVATGLTNKAIAQRLGISDHTVKFHVAAVLAKLGAESRTEAVHLAARRGLLTL
jgi:DNA-binding NarL/FixJ family response regulator